MHTQWESRMGKRWLSSAFGQWGMMASCRSDRNIMADDNTNAIITSASGNISTAYHQLRHKLVGPLIIRTIPTSRHGWCINQCRIGLEQLLYLMMVVTVMKCFWHYLVNEGGYYHASSGTGIGVAVSSQFDLQTGECSSGTLCTCQPTSISQLQYTFFISTCICRGRSRCCS